MITDYEYRYRISGGSFVAPIQCTTENSVDNGDGTITINDIPEGEILAGDFQVRTRAINGKSASVWLVSDTPFTEEETILEFNQPNGMVYGESPQPLSIYTNKDYDDIYLVSSDTGVATVSKISGIWHLTALAGGIVDLTASIDGAVPIERTVSIQSQFSDLVFNGFSVDPYESGGRLYINEGSTSFDKYINFPAPTNETDIEFLVEYEVVSPFYGLGVGKRSINNWHNISLMGQLDLAAKGARLWSVTPTTQDIVVQNDGAFLNDIGDIIEHSYKQIGNQVIITGRNVTKSIDIDVIRTNNLSPVKDFFIPNASVISFWCFGGQYIINKINRISNRVLNAKVTFIGDSKTFGYSAEDYADTFFSIVKANFGGSANNFGGDGDRTVEAVQTIDNTLQGVGVGQFVIVCIGRNDIASGVPTLTWQGNYQSIITKIKATGATVIHLKNIPETTSFTEVNDYIDEEFSLDLKIDPSVGWNMGTMLSADNIHPNATGHAFVADKIISSGYII